MDLRQLRYFYHTSKAQSLLSASKSLYVSQQALGKSIRNLEDELGVQLFYRSSTGIVLTEQGKVFAERVEKILENLDLAIQEVQQSSKRENMVPLNLGFSHMALGDHAGIPLSIIALFKQEHPNISLSFTEYSTRGCELCLQQDKMDMAVITGVPDKTIFDTIILDEYELCVTLRKNHQLAKKPVISIKDLEGYPLLLMPNDIHFWADVNRACEFCSFKPWIIQEFAQLTLLLDRILNDNAVFFTPKGMPGFFDNKQLLHIPLESKIPLRKTLSLITKKGRQLSSASVTFQYYIFKYFIDKRAAERGASSP
ncbi:MAG: LysR substrate-binding domain-containing protein [Christensenellales bacterium]|jgi:DNA-binding transcriptional LysR family regulator